MEQGPVELRREGEALGRHQEEAGARRRQEPGRERTRVPHMGGQPVSQEAPGSNEYGRSREVPEVGGSPGSGEECGLNQRAKGPPDRLVPGGA